MPRVVPFGVEQYTSAWAMTATKRSSSHGWLPGLGKQGEESQPEGLVTILHMKLSRPREQHWMRMAGYQGFESQSEETAGTEGEA